MRDGHRIQNSKLLQVAYNYCIYKQSLSSLLCDHWTFLEPVQIVFLTEKIVRAIVK